MADEEAIRIVNEFADVRVKEVETDRGNRLQISSRQGAVQLDATSLECLSWQDHEFFTEILGENPRGPPGFYEDPETISDG